MTIDDGPQTPSPPPPARPGASFFTIEGRAAPGLFVVGWLASILGLALTFVGALSASTPLVFLAGPGLLSIGLIAACGNQALERRSRGEQYAGPSPFLVFAAIVAVTYFVGFVLGVALDFAIGPDRQLAAPIVQLIGGLLTAAIFVGVVRLTVVGTDALTWADMRIRRIDRRALDDLAIGASLAAPVIVVTVAVSALLVALFKVQPTSPLPPTGTTTGLILQLLTGALIAPIAEEIFFRGFALTAWERSLGAGRAIIRSSLLFVLAHVISIEGTTLGEAIGLIAVGALSRLPVAWVLGLVFVRRRSIWASIGLHATFNGVLVLVAASRIGQP